MSQQPTEAEIQEFFSKYRAVVQEEIAKGVSHSINNACFSKCVPVPGPTLTRTEENCITACATKYLAVRSVVAQKYVEDSKYMAQRE